MRRTVPGEPHRLVAPGMRAALPSGAVGDADAALHGTIVAFLMRALAIYTLALWGVVGRGTRQAQHGVCVHNIALV
jgi:hypothetical protein